MMVPCKHVKGPKLFNCPSLAWVKFTADHTWLALQYECV